jgi:hypothetical protein
MRIVPADPDYLRPFYWVHEKTGVLAEAVRAYITGDTLTEIQFSYMRAYLKQWMRYPWDGDHIEGLRRDLETMTTPAELAAWLDRACDSNVNPL